MITSSRTSLWLILLLLLTGRAGAQVSWAPMSFTTDGAPQFLWVDSADSSVYVCSNTMVNVNSQPCHYGFRYRHGVASRLPFEDSIVYQPYAMTRYKGRLIVAAGSVVGAYDPVHGWETIVPYNQANPALIISLCVYGDTLLMGGNFSNLNGTGISTIAAYDGTTIRNFHRVDTAIPAGWTVGSIVEYRGDIVIAGNFDRPNNLNEIARWDGQRWRDVGGGIPTNGIGDVWKLLVHRDQLYVAGNFRESSGAPGNNIARWDGTQWHRLGDGVQPGGAIYDMIAVGDTIVVSGPFRKVNGSPGYGYARYYNGRWCANTDSTDLAVGNVVNFYDTVIIGGAFNFIGGQSYTHLARVTGQSDCLSNLAASGSALPSGAAFYLYPNPVRGSARLHCAQPAIVDIFDMAGRRVSRQTAAAGETVLQLQGWSPGAAFLLRAVGKDGTVWQTKFRWEE